MKLQTTLLILTLAWTLNLPTTQCIDRSYNSTRIVLQTDMDTVIIHTDLRALQTALKHTKGELATAQIGVVINMIGQQTTSKKHKILGDVLRSLEGEIDDALDRLKQIFATHRTDRQPRAFEFLGDMLSGITGVPSARDHRRLLEEVRMLKLDNEGVKILMESRNTQQRGIIDTLTQHDNKLANLNSRLRSTEAFILNHNKEDLQFAGIIALMEKANLALARANQIIIKVNDILMLGDSGRLSRYVISKSKLGGILDSITLRREDGGPIYGREDVEQYYVQELSHSWTIEERYEIVTLIQIPIAPLNRRLELQILDQTNKITSDLTMAIIDKQANSYRYLSLSDFHRCTSLRDTLICQKRPIHILPRMGCSLRIKNCNTWATHVVHDVTNTNFIYMSNMTTNLTATCGEKRTVRTYTLPTKALINVPLSCSVMTNQFTIDVVKFANTLDIEGEQNDLQIDIQIDPDVLSPEPIKTLTTTIDSNTNNLTELRELNNKFSADLESQRQQIQAYWNNKDMDDSFWYTITIWSVIGTTTTICILLIIWLAKLNMMTNKQLRVQKRERREQETAYNDVIERIRHVETATKLIIQQSEGQNN